MRLPRDLRDRLEKASSRCNQSISEYIRTIIEKHVDSAKVDSWKIVLWSLFDVNISKINYALARSTSVEEFFSYISNFVNKKIKIRPNMPSGLVDLNFIVGDREYNVKQQEELTLYESIASVVEELETKLMEDYNG